VLSAPDPRRPNKKIRRPHRPLVSPEMGDSPDGELVPAQPKLGVATRRAMRQQWRG
jgi:hypothetical protein